MIAKQVRGNWKKEETIHQAMDYWDSFDPVLKEVIPLL